MILLDEFFLSRPLPHPSLFPIGPLPALLLLTNLVFNSRLTISFIVEFKCLEKTSTTYSSSGQQRQETIPPSVTKRICTPLSMPLLPEMFHPGNVFPSAWMSMEMMIQYHPGKLPNTTFTFVIPRSCLNLNSPIQTSATRWICHPSESLTRITNITSRTSCRVSGPGGRRYSCVLSHLLVRLIV